MRQLLIFLVVFVAAWLHGLDPSLSPSPSDILSGITVVIRDTTQ